MKRYIIIKCPKFSKLSFDNILGVKDIVPNIKDTRAKKNRNTVLYRTVFVGGVHLYVRVFDKKIYLFRRI